MLQKAYTHGAGNLISLQKGKRGKTTVAGKERPPKREENLIILFYVSVVRKEHTGLLFCFFVFFREDTSYVSITAVFQISDS